MTTLAFRERLRLWRGTRTQKEAAAVLGVTEACYIKWEHGGRTPKPLTESEVNRRMMSNPDIKR